MKADMKGLNQLEAATLMEEMNCINGMLNRGTPEEKARARKLFKEHYEGVCLQHLNQDSIRLAQIELGITDEDMGLPKTENIY